MKDEKGTDQGRNETEGTQRNGVDIEKVAILEDMMIAMMTEIETTEEGKETTDRMIEAKETRDREKKRIETRSFETRSFETTDRGKRSFGMVNILPVI
jgi:hypothetical protein